MSVEGKHWVALVLGAGTFVVLLAEIAIMECAREKLAISMSLPKKEVAKSIAAGLLAGVATVAFGGVWGAAPPKEESIFHIELISIAVAGFAVLYALEVCHHSVGGEHACNHSSCAENSRPTRPSAVNPGLPPPLKMTELPLDMAVCTACNESPDLKARVVYSDRQALQSKPRDLRGQAIHLSGFVVATFLWMLHGFVDGVAVALQGDVVRAIFVSAAVTLCATLDVLAFGLFLEVHLRKLVVLPSAIALRRGFLALFAAMFPVGIVVSSWAARSLGKGHGLEYVTAAAAGCLLYIALFELFPPMSAGGRRRALRNGLALVGGAGFAACVAVAEDMLA